MKSIINGVRYDTDKAELIGESSDANGYAFKGDFRWYEEGLYRSPKSGRYFLAGRGGAMTRYSQRIGEGWTGGSKIIPLSKKEAFEWAQVALGASKVEDHFGDLLEDA